MRWLLHLIFIYMYIKADPYRLCYPSTLAADPILRRWRTIGSDLSYVHNGPDRFQSGAVSRTGESECPGQHRWYECQETRGTAFSMQVNINICVFFLSYLWIGENGNSLKIIKTKLNWLLCVFVFSDLYLFYRNWRWTFSVRYGRSVI